MLQDARNIESGTEISCDLCIVGGGAAGISIANRLRGDQFKVVLLESGGLQREPQTQSLYAGEVVDPAAHPPLDQWRERRFGGTTTVWEGRLAPFDPIDFRARDYVPHSGWPFPKEHLDPFYAAAHELCEAGPLTEDLQQLLPPGEATALIEDFASDELLTDKVYLFSPPTNFARRFAHLTSRSCRHQVLPHANCIGIESDPSGTHVAHLRVASLSPKRQFTVRARYYILATGGLEVPRLLLASNIGNEHDLVGRYYLSHVAATVPVRFAPGRQIVWNYQFTSDGVYALRAMALSPGVQRQRGLLNHRASINRPVAADASHGNALLSALTIARAFRRHDMAEVGAHARNLLSGLPDSVGLAARYAGKSLPRRRKSPQIVQCPSRGNRYMLRLDTEQAPNPNSRVTLSDHAVDALGMAQLRVDWRSTELDARNWTRTIRLISQTLEEHGAGCVDMSPQFETDFRPTALAAHHLGGARMHDEPTQGVVDAQCKVHGMDNLFVASSAVFPTASHANPTLTIIALSLRLADHVTQLLA